jgi:hypothetical protein
MRAKLYLDVKNRLKSITGADGEPMFRHFDLWNRQVEFIEQETGIAFPAIFVEFAPIQWRTLGNRVQDATLTVRLHIVTEWFAETADHSPVEERALAYLDIADRVAAAMQGFAPEGAGAWMRSQSITDHDHGQYTDSVEEYVCNLRDLSAVETGYVQVTPEIKTRRT